MPTTIDLDQRETTKGCVSGKTPCLSLDAVIDATDAQLVTIIDSLREACLETGFFYLDVGSERAAVDKALERALDFFQLADNDERKTRSPRGQDGYGWTPMFSEPAYQPGTVAHLEAFDCGIEDVRNTGARNIWPDVPGFQQDAVQCWDTASDIGRVVLRLLSTAAGFNADFLGEACGSRELNTMRMIHYPESDIAADDRNVGISAHTDFECATLIYQTAPGLELRTAKGHWLDAPSADGRFVVLLGDMLERYTNGYFRATGHRVRHTRHQRMSLVMFLAVNGDVRVEPRAPHVDKFNPPRYAGIYQGDHIDAEIERARSNAA